MNLNKQIKKYRTIHNFSQEELAAKLYVSRQTISNWENEKSYPDIHNILLMSVLFNVSLDDLVKGDVDMMRNELQNAHLNKWTVLTVSFMLGGIISVGPILKWFDSKGLIITFVLIALSIYSSHQIEKIKKENNLQTYKDILAFQEGRQLTEEEEVEGAKKNKYIVLFSMVVSAVVCGGGVWLILKIFNV